jgi:TPR repeat protein
MERNNTDVIVNYLKANLDNADILYALGGMYLQSGQIDFAIDCMKKANELGLVSATNSLGDIYYSDKNDLKKAIYYYKKGAISGYGPSQFNLGIIYKKHIKDRKKAKYWLLKAANNTSSFDEHVRKEARRYYNEL